MKLDYLSILLSSSLLVTWATALPNEKSLLHRRADGKLPDVDVFSRFRVEMGSGEKGKNDYYGGTCKDWGSKVDGFPGFKQIYQEAIDMAQVALDALDKYSSDELVRKYAKQYFGIKQGRGTSVAPLSKENLEFARNAYKKIIDDSKNQHSAKSPSLFCGPDWLVQTEHEHDRKTGKKTDKELPCEFSPQWWSPYMKQMEGMKNSCADPSKRVLAATSIHKHAIMFCDESLKSKPSLQIFHKGERKPKEGAPLYKTLSIPGTLLHELMHMLSSGGDEIIDQKTIPPDNNDPNEVDSGDSDPKEDPDKTVAYHPKYCAALSKKSTSKAIKNADSYRWFAAAVYIRDCDWTEFKCKPISKETDC